MHFATLTYGGGYENERAYALDYGDLQKLFKRLRKAGYRFKYVSVGEYGTKFSRGHWHCLFFWTSAPPEFEALDQRIDWDEFWPHGLVQFEYPRSSTASAVYIMDYLDKDNLAGGDLNYSKVPQLGLEYLLEYARKHARAGLPLFAQGEHFTVDLPGQISKKGVPFYYPVRRDEALYLKMLHAWLTEWAMVRPYQALKTTPQIEEFIDEGVGNGFEFSAPCHPYLWRHYQIDFTDYDRTATHSSVINYPFVHQEYSNRCLRLTVTLKNNRRFTKWERAVPRVQALSETQRDLLAKRMCEAQHELLVQLAQQLGYDTSEIPIPPTSPGSELPPSNVPIGYLKNGLRPHNFRL